jgi:hypothetical protein
MAGFVGDERQWRKFNKRVTKLFNRYKVDIFHTIDLKRTNKDFLGWKVDKKIEFLDEFHHVINETVEIGFSSFIRSDDYDYYRGLPRPKKAKTDSLYGILFRSSLAAITDAVIRVPRWAERDEPKLNIVLESGHNNAPDAIRLYNSAKKVFGESKALSGLTFANKANCLPLAAADLFAYSVFGKETQAKPLGRAKRVSKSDLSYKGNMFHIAIGRETLDLLHEQSLADRI